MTNTLLAVDSSTHKIGWACFSSKEPGKWVLGDSEQYELDDQKLMVPLSERLYRMHSKIHTLVGLYEPKIIVTENPATLARFAPTAAKFLAQNLGVMRLACHNYQLELEEANPVRGKYAVTFTGKATKKQVVKAVQGLFPSISLKDDEEDRADAISIGMGWILYEVEGLKKEEITKDAVDSMFSDRVLKYNHE